MSEEDVLTQEAAAAAPAVDEATSNQPRRAGRRVLAPIDLVTPVVVAVGVVALYAYVYSGDHGQIVDNILDPSKVISATIDHIVLSVTIAALVICLAVPLGIVVTRQRTKWLSPIVLVIGNIGQSAPSLGLLALVGIYAIGFWAVVLILTAYAALSVLRNTIVGLEAVDSGVLDAAKGMGMSPGAVLLRVELPLAVPVIAAGARTALILAVATVPLGQNLNAGGLGQALFGSIKTNRPIATATIAITITALALILDWVAALLQRASTPRGIR